jgi:hypothetical protein
MIPDKASPFRNLMTGCFGQFRHHGRAWRRPSGITQGISSYDWMAGAGPVITVKRKFANVFMTYFASGNIRVIKFRDDDAWSKRRPGSQSLARLERLAFA